MALTAADSFSTYFKNLSATNEICVALGTTLSEGTTLFTDYEPTTVASCIIVTSYGGGKPDKDGYKRLTSVSIMIKGKSRQMIKKTAQSVINVLHENGNVLTGLVIADTSEPLPVEVYEGAEYIKYSTNFTVKYIKL